MCISVCTCSARSDGTVCGLLLEVALLRAKVPVRSFTFSEHHDYVMVLLSLPNESYFVNFTETEYSDEVMFMQLLDSSREKQQEVYADLFFCLPCFQFSLALHPSMAEVEQDRSQSSTPVTELSNRILDTSFEEKAAVGGGGKLGGGISLGTEAVLINGARPSHKRRSSESETRDTKRQYSLERKEESPERARERPRDREGRGGSSCRSKTPSAASTFSSSSSSSSAKANTVSGPIMLESSEATGDEAEAVSPETNLRCLVNFFRYSSCPDCCKWIILTLFV